MRLPNNVITGLLFLLPAFTVLGFWYVSLFVGNPPCCDIPFQRLRVLLNESPQPISFRWLLILPALYLTFAGLCFSRIPRTHLGAVGPFSASVLLAIASWLTITSTAIVATLPLIYGFKKCARAFNPALERDAVNDLIFLFHAQRAASLSFMLGITRNGY
jgi:hypothetical protein